MPSSIRRQSTPALTICPRSSSRIRWPSFGVSDGGAHTKFFTGGRYATGTLIKFVRDNPVMSLEEAHFPLSAHDFPGGEWRRVQRAQGYRTIMVNGSEAGRVGLGRGGPDPPGRHLRADLLSLEERIRRSGTGPGARVQTTSRRKFFLAQAGLIAERSYPAAEFLGDVGRPPGHRRTRKRPVVEESTDYESRLG